MSILTAPGLRGRTRLYLVAAIAAAAVVFVGFSRTFYLAGVFDSPPLSALQVVHGVVFSAWMLLFVVQSFLVSARRVDVHRRLGVAGGVLAAIMIVVGLAVARHAAMFGFKTPGLPPPHVFVVVPFVDILLFTGFVGSALYWRRRPETHKRLMLLGTLSMLPPAIARIPLAVIRAALPVSAFVVADVFLVACAAIDWRRTGRLHPVYVWGGLLFVLSFPLRIGLAMTPWWLAFVRWATT